MQEAVERIRDVQNVQIFQNELLLLKEYMKNKKIKKKLKKLVIIADKHA